MLNRHPSITCRIFFSKYEEALQRLRIDFKNTYNLHDAYILILELCVMCSRISLLGIFSFPISHEVRGTRILFPFQQMYDKLHKFNTELHLTT